jgi:HlyD family secretion protein
VVVRARRAAEAVPDASSGWGRTGHWRAVVTGGLVTAVIVGAGVAAWAATSGGSSGYRTASVTRADIGTTMALVGDVQPVSDAAPSFQVGGKVATVTVTPGQPVTAGQTLGTLDTTALSETVSSAQSTLAADEAKLVEDEQNQSRAAGSSPPSNTGASTTSTTTPTGTTGGPGGSSATITEDQSTLTQDEKALSTDQQKEGADLAQAQTDCTTANTDTPAGQATCEAALQTVSADEQQVSKDQATVSKDETALGQALDTASSSPGGSTGNSGPSPAQSSHALSNAPTGATGNSGAGANASPNGASGGSGTNGGSGSSTTTDTPAQIASDQAAIDTAEAQLTNARQSLDEATLTSPIAGTVVSVGIGVGDTVSAGSSTEIITIIGTKSYEVQATLDSFQIPSVKVGQSATVEIDGVDGQLTGTVSQVGPVQSGSSGYTYPVLVSLDSTNGIFTGSTAGVIIATGAVSDVVAVPTSAVQRLGTRAYVLELSQGRLTRKVITIGMVGPEYTQVLSGLAPGQSVVLADYAAPVPSSNTNTLGGGGGFLGGGGFGPGGFRVQRVGGGPGSSSGNAAIGG